MGYLQTRLGPVKVSFNGIFQPVLDGLKLLVKPRLELKHAYRWMYWGIRYLRLCLSFMLWLVIPYSCWELSEFQFLWLVSILGLNCYFLLLAGFRGLSKYSLLGSLRALRQAVSFEVVLTLLIFLPYINNEVFNWGCLMLRNWYLFLALFVLMFVMESQKPPFDLAEGERELVSGFNTEYGGLLFVYFFLAEYGNILILGLFLSIIFLKLRLRRVSFILFWLYLRATFPRVRYDILMGLTWLFLLPLALILYVRFYCW